VLPQGRACRGDFWSTTPYSLSSVLSNGTITETLVAIILEQTILQESKRLH
jgi:xanthine/uracil permease